MTTIIICAAAAISMWGLSLYARAAVTGHGRAWRQAFWRAWRNR